MARDVSTGGLGEPATHSEAGSIGELTYLSRGIYVGGTGDLVVRMKDGSTATFVAVPTGSILPIRISAILDGTTATSIISLY